MGIKEMLVREDFFKILRDTIIEYAHTVLQLDIQCDYHPFAGGEPWCVNATLGFVSRTPAPKGVRLYMRSEYNVRGNIAKNIIGKIGVYLITAFPFIGAVKTIYVSKGVFPKPVFIVPQNRSIRFYNYETGIVDCIAKSGFTHKYFDNQAYFRDTYKYDFLNPMLSHGDGWFREPVLTGHPLVRTTDTKLFVKGNKESILYLKTIAKDTLEWQPGRTYINGLKETVKSKLLLAEKNKEIRNASAVNHLIDLAVSYTKNINRDIPTCMSHGDFQAGNIWVEPSGNTIIYDWETAGRRSVWYDSATLSYSLRRVYGWASLLDDTTGKGLFLCSPEGVKNDFTKREITGIILLEDILFYLEDMLELPEFWGRDIFERFMDNLNTLNWK